MSLISLALQAMIFENVVLMKFLGLCPFFGNSNKTKDAVGMGACVILITIISSTIAYFLYKSVLVPSNTEYLATIAFILIIAAMVQILEIIVRHLYKTLHTSLGIYLPLITTNCVVLGVALLASQSDYTWIEMLVYSFSCSVGFFIVLYLFATIREHINTKPIPRPFQGIPIALIIAAIMSLLFGSLS